MDYKKLAEMLFPGVESADEVLKRYPKRALKEGQQVTRYAPSPTGMMHIGNFFQCFISYCLAKNSDGVFIVRTEDTDQERQVEGAMDVIFNNLKTYGIFPDEYEMPNGETKGDYGPYIQSKRPNFYAIFAKQLVAEGKAFPCFCEAKGGKAEILKERETKFIDTDNTEYDECRNLTFEQIERNIKEGKKFAIRLKTKGNGKDRIKFVDLIKGGIEAQANAKDVVILKSDGLAPYTFAHIVDDMLMGITIVVRGEEYIASTPVHLEIIEALGLERPKYCHNPLIWKIGDNGNKRKISKRYDPEADMRFYEREGYPTDAVIEYLLNLINSGFETWRNNNPQKSWREFKFGINEITTIAPIFDLVKLNDISKSVIARMNADEVYESVLKWAKVNDKDFAEFLINNEEYSKKVFNIDRDKPKPRKDIYNWGMIKEHFYYMFREPNLEELAIEDIDKYNEFMRAYSAQFKFPTDKDSWFANVKEVASRLGYATDNKAYKANPELYKGNTAKVCEFIRLALTGKKDAPDLFELMTILGEEKVLKRIKKEGNNA